MKFILTTIIMLKVVSAFSQDKKSDLINDILTIERKIVDAVIKTDTATVSQLLAKDYTYTLPDGKIISKKQYLSDIALWWRPVSIDHSDQKVSLYNGTVVVLGKAKYRWRNKTGEIEEANEQYTDTYVKIEKRWTRVSSHASCLSGRCT
jgi:hypothetical protein